MRLRGGLLAALLLLSSPATASHSLITPGTAVTIAKSTLTVTANQEWNKIDERQGPYTERWTIDGVHLNELAFFAAIPSGMSLFGKVGKKDMPIPLFNATMLITDIPAMFESTYRAWGGVTVLTMEGIEPATFVGKQGIRFTYDITHHDDVRRKGEGYAAIVDGQLYIITFEAPTLHFFDAGIAAARAVAASAILAPKKK
jgi:hypothetical protein